jgi:hypothetical protein
MFRLKLILYFTAKKNRLATPRKVPEKSSSTSVTALSADRMPVREFSSEWRSATEAKLEITIRSKLDLRLPNAAIYFLCILSF